MSAYVLLYLDIRNAPPIPVGVRICSESAEGVAMDHSRHAAVTVFSVPGDSFAESLREAERLIETSRHYEWLRPLMAKAPSNG